MAALYLINEFDKGFYVHFNPHKKEYFVSDKVLGAAVFEKIPGTDFINDVLDPGWELERTQPQITVRGSRSAEPRWFDKTH